MTVVPRSRRGALTSRQTASALGGLALLLVAASAVLTVVAGDLSVSGGGGTIALAMTFLATGFLVALRQPRNPIGWLLMCTGLSTAFTTAAGLYTLLDYRSAHGSLPFGPAVFLAENTFWPVAVLTGMAAVLLFPDEQAVQAVAPRAVGLRGRRCLGTGLAGHPGGGDRGRG